VNLRSRLLGFPHVQFWHPKMARDWIVHIARAIVAISSLRLVAGVDLNHRPLGYEGKTVRHPMRTSQVKSKKIFE
jgi:hypothetical protein